MELGLTWFTSDRKNTTFCPGLHLFRPPGRGNASVRGLEERTPRCRRWIVMVLLTGLT